MLLTEQKVNCEMCKKECKVFSGFEHWTIVEKAVIKPLCEDCSQKVKDFIGEYVKTPPQT